MKLFEAGLTLATLVGLGSSATQPPAEVFIFEANSKHTTTPKLPRQLARHVLLQRVSSAGALDSLDSLRDIPEGTDEEEALSHIATYGRSPAPLFEQVPSKNPSQLVVILEGITPDNSQPLRKVWTQPPAFTVSDPPSYAANQHLLANLATAGAAINTACDLENVINPSERSCWPGSSTVVRYDVKKNPETITTLVNNLGRLSKLVSDRDLEATILLMPESSRSSKLTHWTHADTTSDLHSREEIVIASAVPATILSDTDAAPGIPPSHPQLLPAFDLAKARKLPQCFDSANSCASQTNNCSGHGACHNKGASKGGQKSACFACACTPMLNSTSSGGNRTFYWAGNMCQKEDVSVSFWLLFTIGLGLAAAVAFAIGLLFSVGEEPLPGVIGAGVSRASK